MSNRDKLCWGEISYSVRLINETMDFGFWAGYFEEANVLSIDFEGFGTDYDNLFLVQEDSGAYGFYKNVYGIVGRYKIEGLEKDKIAGAEIAMDASVSPDTIGSTLTLNLEKNSTIYNFAANAFDATELPTTIVLTVSQSRFAFEAWEKQDYGNVDSIITLQNTDMGIEFDVGCYTWVGRSHIISIEAYSLGLGVSSMFILVGAGQSTHYFYTDLKNFELLDEMATINYIGLNGNVLSSKRSRVGSYVPTFDCESAVSGYKFVGWTSTNTDENGDGVLVAGTNNVYALYVKESENDGATLTINSTGNYGVNIGDKINCEMSTESMIYQYLASEYGSSVATTITWVITNSEWDANEKCTRYYIEVEGMEGSTNDVRYYYNLNMIATRIYINGILSGTAYFVTDEDRLGNGVVFNCYRKIYSYNNVFVG